MDATGIQTQAGRAALRTMIKSMDDEMARLTTMATDGSATTLAPLAALWADIVRTLDLGPAPRLRSCPVCGATCRAAATLCGSCWNKLEPLPDVERAPG